MRPSHLRRRALFTLFVAVSLLLTLPSPAGARGKSTGFLTKDPAMLAAVAPGTQIKPLISVGDELADGYVFPSIPDGIGIDPRGDQFGFDVYVAHETSAVPFRGLSDTENAQASRLEVSRGTGKIMGGEIVVSSMENYLRFCSSFMATRAEGFDSPVLWLNEETSDLVNPTGPAWPPGPDAVQAGRAVAYDVDKGEARTIYGMGRHNHENTVAIPGYDQLVLVSGDDTFSAPSAQLYMYLAEDQAAVWEDEGTLWAFQGEGDHNDYGDLVPGDSVAGSFIPVPREVALGDQGVLEDWSNNNNVFQFIRIEDMAYDRTTPNVMYIADTGEPRAIPDPDTGRLQRGPSGTQGDYPNGRIFRMELDPNDPKTVVSLSILINGDALLADSAGVLDLIHNPDNIETTERSLMIQEDPGGQNGYAAGDPNGTTARIWRYDLETGDLYVVAKVDQGADPAADQGNWESSGIVDASDVFGDGAFLVNVQAHSLLIDSRIIDDPTSDDPTVTITQKVEGGQMLLMRVNEKPRQTPPEVRFATFNASLNRSNAGDLAAELAAPGSSQPAAVAEIIQRRRPDVLLINEFDYDAAGEGMANFQENYLGVSHNGADPIRYPYRYSAPSNTGIASGYDLNNDGTIGGPDDAFGFGFFPGQFGMAVYSMYPIDEGSIRTFQTFLWKDMPGALLPVDPATGESWYSDDELEVFRLSSKSHWDVPIIIGSKPVHFLVSHPTPPVFDGAEDRNGTRNHDEIRFWSDYVSPGRNGYIYDDAGRMGGLRNGSLFVIAGDENADPFDGDSIRAAGSILLDNRRIQDPMPTSLGGPDAAIRQNSNNDDHLGDPALDTADFSEAEFGGPGNLRADYVLPSKVLRTKDAGVFWPAADDPLYRLTGPGFPAVSSDHRLVWVDVRHASFSRPPAMPEPRGFASPLFGLATSPNGDILVADAGAGITTIRNGTVGSTIPLPGVAAIGPINGRAMWAVAGGADTETNSGQALYRISNGQIKRIADLFAVEETDPDGAGVDSNPYDVASLGGGGALVIDAGGNDLMRVTHRGRTDVLAVFPPAVVSTANLQGLLGCPNPVIPDLAFICDTPFMETQAVPTSVAVGPDGYYYVGELSGFPGPAGASSIWRVAPGARQAACGASADCVKVFDGGFTSIVDLAFGPDGRLYVAEMDEASWAAVEIFQGGVGGTINACDLNTLACEEIATGLPILTAITFGTDGTLWATQNALIPGLADVVKIR